MKKKWLEKALRKELSCTFKLDTWQIQITPCSSRKSIDITSVRDDDPLATHLQERLEGSKIISRR